MRTAKELASWRVSSEFAKNSSTCKRLASGVRHLAAGDLLGLTDKERETLTKACALIDEIAVLHSRAAKQAAHTDKLRAQREKDVRAAMQPFEGVTTTAGKVALLAFMEPWTFRHGGIVEEWTNDDRATSVCYLMGSYFDKQLREYAGWIARDSKLAKLAAKDAVAAEWDRFQKDCHALQDKHAEVIVRVERTLAEMPAAVQP